MPIVRARPGFGRWHSDSVERNWRHDCRYHVERCLGRRYRGRFRERELDEGLRHTAAHACRTLLRERWGQMANDATAEASLDTQEEITGAPGAKVVLIDIPDLSDGSIMAGYVDAEEYGVAQVISASFGQCERDYFPELNGGVRLSRYPGRLSRTVRAR